MTAQKSRLSASWYRVAAVRPRLRGHVRLTRQAFRGERWFVLEDPAENRVHRFSPAAQRAIVLMDGEHSVDDIYRALESLGEERPTQDELITLLGQLDGANLLSTERRPDLGELSDRAHRQLVGSRWRRFANPLYVRIPLVDPDRFLAATAFIVRPFWSLGGLLVWLVMIGWAFSEAMLHWQALTHDLADRVLAKDNLLILALTFPLLKLLHELGHCYASKLGGAAVHEAGIMTLIVMPVPYVDVTGSGAFRGKWERATVAAAGMLVELFCASLAMVVWLNVEPGLVRAAAFNVLLIAGVSTLIFNGNPLLRFDAYYILSDLIEIPNLATRATRQYAYWLNRHVFGVRGQVSPAHSRGEAAWFGVYAPASYLYRLTVMFSIALFVAVQWHGLGAVLALWTVLTGVALPVGKGVWFLVNSPMLHARRLRALGVTGAALAVLAVFLLAVPLPYGTVTEGVVWAPRGAELHAGAEGRLDRLVAAAGGEVRIADPVARMSDPLLGDRVQLLQAQMQEVSLRYAAVEYADAVQAAMLREQLVYFTSQLKEARDRVAALQVRSPASGKLLVSLPQDLDGQYLRRGELIGYVLDARRATIRVIVPQSEIELVRDDTHDIGLRFASDPLRAYSVPAIAREVPTATRQLPSAALSTAGGGGIVADPADEKHLRAMEIVFEMEVPVPADVTVERLGERVHVRFGHGTRTLGWRLARSIRQTFLRRFEL
jgi:putative peptide zinc metalloprotease protein